eukprot:4241652-Amphidinium_carterae.1
MKAHRRVAKPDTSLLDEQYRFHHPEPLSSYWPCTHAGGLVAGCSIAIKHHFPECVVLPVEPAGYDGAARSLAAGKACCHS